MVGWGGVGGNESGVGSGGRDWQGSDYIGPCRHGRHYLREVIILGLRSHGRVLSREGCDLSRVINRLPLAAVDPPVRDAGNFSWSRA